MKTDEYFREQEEENEFRLWVPFPVWFITFYRQLLSWKYNGCRVPWTDRSKSISSRQLETELPFFPYFLFSCCYCMCMHICVHACAYTVMWMSAHLYVYTHVCGDQRSMPGILLRCFSLYCFEIEYLTELDTHGFNRMAGQWTPGILLSPPPRTWIKDVCPVFDMGVKAFELRPPCLRLKNCTDQTITSPVLLNSLQFTSEIQTLQTNFVSHSFVSYLYF